MFFVGLIIGSIPTIYKKAKQGKLKIADIIGFIIAIVVAINEFFSFFIFLLFLSIF